MKTKEMEQHALQVSDYLKQSQEVKTSYLIFKKKSYTHFCNSLTVSVLPLWPLIGFYVLLVLHLNPCFEYTLSIFPTPLQPPPPPFFLPLLVFLRSVYWSTSNSSWVFLAWKIDKSGIFENVLKFMKVVRWKKHRYLQSAFRGGARVNRSKPLGGRLSPIWAGAFSNWSFLRMGWFISWSRKPLAWCGLANRLSRPLCRRAAGDLGIAACRGLQHWGSVMLQPVFLTVCKYVLTFLPSTVWEARDLTVAMVWTLFLWTQELCPHYLHECTLITSWMWSVEGSN